MNYDVRYPFTSAIDFFKNAHFLELEALHLTIGFVLLSVAVIRLFFLNRSSITLKFSIIFFCASIFNNPSYKIGITISELTGVCAALLFILRGTFSFNPFSKYMVWFFTIALLHYFVLVLVDENVSKNFEFYRLAIFMKIPVLCLNVMVLFHYIKNDKDVRYFIKQALFFFNSVGIVYSLQIGLFLSGIIPYGTFSPAGWVETPLPSFGGPSIERGHLGKFFVPLFPFYLYCYLYLGLRKSYVSYLLVAFLNFSASSYAFLILYLIGTITLFYNKFRQLVIIMLLSLISVLLIFITSAIGVAKKVYYLGIVAEKGQGGGRSFEWLYDILERFPYGYGYGGSSFRNFHGIKGLDLNNAVVIFFGQTSMIGLLLLFFYVICIYEVIKLRRYLPDVYQRRLLAFAIFMMSFIFLADVLWFVPSIWMPVILLTVAARNQKCGASGNLA